MNETSFTTTPNTEPISSNEAADRLRALFKLDEEIMRYVLVERRTELPDGTPEINAIHSMRLAIMTFAYYSKYPVEGIDPYKAAVDVILHDFVEGRANDVPTLTASEADFAEKAENEARALEELQQELGPDWPELLEALHTYEEQQLRRVRAVRLMDKLDPGYTHVNNGGTVLRALGIQSPAALRVHDERLEERFKDLREENPDLATLLRVMREHVADMSFNGYEQLMIEFDT
jgi:5'-deoxynucleotidase YfbR-like HD superfamily hydrolase